MKEKILSFMAAMILLGVSQVLAEEKQDTADDNVILEPITVTASRTERRLSEVSSSVSIIPEKEIRDTNARSVPDLLRDMEGVYTYDSSGVGTTGNVNMRGFWGGMSTHQLVLIDGIPQNKGKDKLVDWDLIPLDNIESVEVLKGPASSLYGDNAMSGVINIITKKPGPVPQARISSSCGSFNTQNYEGSISGRSVKGGIAYNLIASRKSTDGFRTHCDYEGSHLNGKLDFLIDETQCLGLSMDYHDRKRGALPWALTEVQIAQDRRQARPGTENDKEDAIKTDINIDYNKKMDTIAPFSIANTFYYRYDDSKAFYTNGSTAASTKEQLGNEDTYGLLLRYNIDPEVFRLSHFFTAGIDLERNSFDYKEYTAPYQLRGALSSDYNVIRDKVGPYLQDEIKLFEPLRFIIGYRYDSVAFDFNDTRNNANSKNKDMSQFTPHYGIVYTYQKDSNVYTNYGQAFKTPTIGQMFTYTTGANPDLNPEKAKNYEAGIRHRFNDHLKANISFYWMELDNEIWYDYAANKYNNYGKTSHEGVETSLDFKIIERLTGFVNYAYTRAKNENGTDAGRYLTNIPMHKGSLGLKGKTKLGMEANLVVTKMGSSYIDSANNDKLSSYTTVDTKIAYEHKWWSVFLAVDNLLNKKYNSYGYKSGTTKYFNPAQARTFTSGIKLTF